MKIVCLTSNLYLNCLQPFAYLWNLAIAEKPPVTVVGYEAEPPELPDNFSFVSIGNQADFTWSSGLLHYLSQIDDEIIGLLLEDYFLQCAVDWARVGDLYHLMEMNTDIAKIDLTDDRLKVGYLPLGDHAGFQLIQSSTTALFQTSLQAAFWRTDFLTSFLAPHENAWQFEKGGTRRVIAARQSGAFRGIILGTRNPPLNYVNAIGGEGNMPGVWALKRFPQWMIKDLTAKGWING